MASETVSDGDASTTGSAAATVASVALIAQQVSGKAVRDALFLSNFPVTALPLVMVAAAVLSLTAVLWFSGLMARSSPAKLIPILFGVSAVALLGEWALCLASPKAGAIAVYLHTATFGPAMISGFWSLVSERFDPHTAKRAVARITEGATLGGVVGGIAAWRAAAFVTVPTMIPFLASLSLVCTIATISLRGTRPRTTEHGSLSAPFAVAPFQVLRNTPYLRNLASLVTMSALTSALLDYVFSSQAAATHAKGAALLSFFAFFWLAVSIFTLALQAFFGRIALEKWGLAVSVGILPGVVILGATIGLSAPGLASVSLLRGAEAVQRNSIFRSAYELLYVPVSKKKKRATKTIIDVGFDRLGTVIGSATTLLALWLVPARSSALLLGLAVVIALATLPLTHRLHLGYVSVLAESLRKGATRLGLPATADEGQRLTFAAELRETDDRERLMEEIEALQPGGLSVLFGALRAPNVAKVGEKGLAASERATNGLTEFLSRDPVRIREHLRSGPLLPELVPMTIMLLARQELHGEALRALREVAPRATGQLIDALVDPSVEFMVRRRVPRALSECATQRAADGLLLGMGDERFEVRYQCGRALLQITERAPAITITLERVLHCVKREVVLNKVLGNRPSSDSADDDDDEPNTFVGRLVADRIDRTLEHVFRILSLSLEREPLRMAFRALHHGDVNHRGTALEYLGTVLPKDVRDAIWPFLGEKRAPMKRARPPEDVLKDLLRSASNDFPPESEGSPGSR
jgi:AAA family ATP:ADP antiporter